MARSNNVPVRVKADGVNATRINDKNVLILRESEIAGRGRVVCPRLESPEQLFVPWSVMGIVRSSHVVVNDQGRVRRIGFCQFGAEQLVIAGPGLWKGIRRDLNLFAV